MNLDEIGKFISRCRKEVNLTQSELAEKLNITDRAVSKWETGNGLPDASIMLDLCSILNINVNELLSGKRIEMENYNKEVEKNILKLKEYEEMQNRSKLRLEMIFCYTASIVFLILIFISSFGSIDNISRTILLIVAITLFLLGVFTALHLERTAGYYECNNCHHKYIPKNGLFIFSMHIGRTRYLKCPKCNKYTWNKKVLTK